MGTRVVPSERLRHELSALIAETNRARILSKSLACSSVVEISTAIYFGAGERKAKGGAPRHVR